jgi:Subtilase family
LNLTVRLSAVAAIVILSACGGRNAGEALPFAGQAPMAASANPLLSPEFGTYRRACDAGPRPGYSQCFAIQRVDAGARISIHAPHSALSQCETGLHPGCFGPPGLQKLYNIVSASKTGGKGMTVGLVDAYGYPGIQNDLNTYRKFFGLPACGKGCFTVVNQLGKAGPLPQAGPAKDDWRPEQALDIDMVSAICPNCKILLVQTNDDNNYNLEAGVNAAVALRADVVSNSYGCPESVCLSLPTNPAYAHKGVLILASAGDSGAQAEQPCSLASVICVGGTSVAESGGARGFTETVWDELVKHQCTNGPCATGSGCSGIVMKPSWQHDKGCTGRSESDLSVVADPLTGVIVACAPCTGDPKKPLEGDWGGTSASSPIVAAMYALAGNAKTQSGATLWAHNGKGFNDVISGTNSHVDAGTIICPKSYAYICKAGKGYDGPTGWGTPNGLGSL